MASARSVHAERHHRQQQREQPLIFQLQAQHLFARAIEFLILIVLRVERVDDVDARQIFTATRLIWSVVFCTSRNRGRQLAMMASTVPAQDDNERRRHRRQLPALAGGF